MVGLREQFNVTFVFEGEKSPSDFRWAAGEDFQLVWGPQQSRSTSIQTINGKTTKSSQVAYTYVLVPKSVGKFTLPVATVKVKGKELTSNAVTVEVVSDGESSDSRTSSQQNGRNTETGGISGDDLFMRLTLDRTDVVVGEPVTAVLKLYQRVNIAGFEDVKPMVFAGVHMFR